MEPLFILMILAGLGAAVVCIIYLWCLLIIAREMIKLNNNFQQLLNKGIRQPQPEFRLKQRCPACDEYIPVNVSCCPLCGFEFVKQKSKPHYCSVCGTLNPQGTPKCSKCGIEITWK